MKSVYYCAVLLTILQRLFELRLSRRNQQKLAAAGFNRRDPVSEFRVMFAVHCAWFAALLTEPYLFARNVPLWIGIPALATFLAAQALRQWTIRSLGMHWNVNVMGPRGAEAGSEAFVTSGPYRFIRHPNYLALILEFLALPLAGGAYFTCAAFSALNALVLRTRISTEEQQLAERPGYRDYMRTHRALLPRLKSIR